MPQSNQQKGVITLIFLLVVGFFALGLAMTSGTKTILELKKNINTISADQSFYTAEAAVSEGIYQYIKNDSESGNFSLTINDIPPSSISFAISPSPRGWAYRESEGNAGNNLTNRKVKNTFLLFPAGAAFDYAVYSENNLTIKGGNNNIIIGDIFSNEAITCTGNPNIHGNAYYASSINEGSCNDNADSINTGLDIIPLPDIDPYYYGGIADCISDSANVKDDCLSGPTTGVIFVEDPGSTTTLENINLTGNLTVIGNLSLSGGSSISAINDYAAVVVEGNLKITGDTTIYGLVYVRGTTNFSGGNNSIYGSLISVGGTETDIYGSVKIDYKPLSGPPGGIDTSGDPEIISWSEE